MNILKLLIVFTLSLNLFTNDGFTANKNKIVIEGSTTLLPIVQRAAEEFMNLNPNADIKVRGGGSGVGITSLIEGTCDIANSSRNIRDAEIQKAIARNKDPKAHVIAMDGIAVIVNKENRVNSLTKKQIKDIFTGKISNWKLVGGNDQKIVVISRDSSSGTYEVFNELALNKEKVRSDALMQASNQGVINAVSTTPGAIGYVGIGYLKESVIAVSIDGVMPNVTTVLSGKYVYSRPLFMYTNGEPKGLIKDFIDFILSPIGQKIVLEEGFVPLK